MERLHDDALLAGPAAPCRGARILKANMEVEAAVEQVHDLTATGMHSVRLHRVGFLGFC